MAVAVTAAGGTITALVGAVVLRLTVTGTYKRYIRPGMGPLLIVAGVGLLGLGLITLVRALRHDEADHHSERVGWLLLAPIAALLLVAPPTLGSFGVDRASAVDVRSPGGAFQPLTGAEGPVAMTLLEFGQRAFDGSGASFSGASVQLTGFVADADDGSFRLARYQIACCAADAAATVVRVVGIEGDPPSRDRWVTVTGTFHPGGTDTPELSATAIQGIPVPDDPYE